MKLVLDSNLIDQGNFTRNLRIHYNQHQNEQKDKVNCIINVLRKMKSY